MTQPIWYDSTEAGAPTLNNVAGSLLEVLRSCLVTGFNAKTVTSIAVTSGVATATCAAHGLLGTYGKLVQISSAPEALLNGNKQPLTVATKTFTFAAPGVADGTYTGTISAKRAPLGWVEAHTGTNVAIFARSVPEATAMLLRVNDSGSNGASLTDARIVMVESATGVDTWVNESPRNADLAGGQYWYKGANTATAKRWAIVGDDRFIWVLTPHTSTLEPYTNVINYFGDVVPYQTPDPYGCVLCGSPSGAGATGLRGGTVNSYASITLSFGEVIARDAAGVAIGAAIGKHAPGASYIGAVTQMQVANSPVVIAKPLHVSQNDLGSAGAIRGEIPGLAAPLARVPFVGQGHFAVITPTVGADQKYLSVLYTIGSSQNGNALIDLSGPWYA
jgi:hypothetical protein